MSENDCFTVIVQYLMKFPSNSCFVSFALHFVLLWKAPKGKDGLRNMFFALDNRKSINHHTVVKRCSPTAGGVGDLRSLYSTVNGLGIITVQLLG